MRSLVFVVASVSAILFASCAAPYFEHRQSVARIVGPERSQGTGSGVSESVPSAVVETEEVLIGPNPEIRERVVSLVNNAASSVEFSVYLLTDEAVVTALSNASARGVRVRGIVEKNVYRIPNANRKSRDRLLNSGADVRYADKDGFSYSHAKYLVADSEKYVLSTGNYAKTTFDKNREFFAFGNDPEMAAFLSATFLADHSGIRAEISVPERAYLAPQDARSKLASLLAAANSEVRAYAPNVSDRKLLEAFARFIAEGKRVRICLSEIPKDVRSFSGMEVVVSGGPYLHAKSVSVPGVGIYFWSANLTENSIDRNREVGIVTNAPEFLSNYENTVRKDCKW